MGEIWMFIVPINFEKLNFNGEWIFFIRIVMRYIFLLKNAR